MASLQPPQREPQREHSVETIRRNSEVMGNLRKLMVANRGVRFDICCTARVKYSI